MLFRSILRDVKINGKIGAKNSEIGTKVSQMFLPSRFLSGIIPTVLLNQYKLWQNDDDSLTGYMAVLESNKSINRSILNIDILRIGLRDSTGFCNALADGLISRIFLSEGPGSMSESEKEFYSVPDTTKPVEYLVNLMSVLSSYVTKYNNINDDIGPWTFR